MNIICAIKLQDGWLKNVDTTTHKPVTTKSQKLAAKVDYKTAVQIVNALQWFGYNAEIVEI